MTRLRRLIVNPDQDSQLAEWRAKGKYTFPVALGGTSDFARTNYRVSETPTNFLLNADSKRVFRHLGYSRGQERVMEAEANGPGRRGAA